MLKQQETREEAARADQSGLPPWRWALREAAAVLGSFDPRQLEPAREDPERWREFLPDCEPVDLPGGHGRWRLRSSIRRQTLRRLGSREAMRRALEPYRGHADEPLQRAIEWLLDGRVGDLAGLSREELAGLAMAREWFEGLVEAPGEEEIRSALPLAELLAPLRQLAGAGFVGRQKELARLADYVGLLQPRDLASVARRAISQAVYTFQDRPPLMVHGPGGVGKSTLLARFILEHLDAGGAGRLPFVYLDIDRPAVNLEQPLTILVEAMRQLAVQHPAAGGDLRRLVEEGEYATRRFDQTETTKFSLDRGFYVDGFARWASRELPGRPILFVLDTFEEAQFLGDAVVSEIWSLLEALQHGLPQLRIVVSGRARPESLPLELLELTELDEPSARARLRAQLGPELDDATAAEILAIVGRSPLSVKVAGQFVRDHGIAKLRSIETRSFVFLRLKTEKVQAQLYGRVLAHVHDADVRKVAYPGLVVRRITPQVIREVLAVPCGIELRDETTADRLFDELAREVALVEPDGPRAVRHRPDVRRLMLGDLLVHVPAETVRDIHERAVEHYRTQTEAVARAEELYHRLRLGQPPALLAERWLEGVEPYLRDALEELPPPARLWLSARLGVTPNAKLLGVADQETWEDLTAQDAQRHLRAGSPAAALGVLRRRKKRGPASPLFRIEAETLHLLGRDGEAREVAASGLESASRAGDRGLAVELDLLVAVIDESGGRLDAALAGVEQAARLLDETADPVRRLRVLVARIRLLRRLGGPLDQERRRLVEQARALLDPPTRRALRDHPALLREVVAEVGQADPDLLRDGIEALGLELVGDRERDRLGQALAAWGARLPLGQAPSPGPERWPDLARGASGPELGRFVLSLLGTLPADADVQEALAQVFRAAVEAAIGRAPSAEKG
jgi:hypothetical protein